MHEGRIFKKLYRLQDFTQTTIAKKLDVSRQTIAEWQDMKELPTGRRQELEKIFNVKFTEFAESNIDDKMPSTQLSTLSDEIKSLRKKVDDLQTIVMNLQSVIIRSGLKMK